MDVSSLRYLVTSHFIIKSVPNNGNLISTLHALVGQTSDKLSDCQEQPLLKWYA